MAAIAPHTLKPITESSDFRGKPIMQYSVLFSPLNPLPIIAECRLSPLRAEFKPISQFSHYRVLALFSAV